MEELGSKLHVLFEKILENASLSDQNLLLLQTVMIFFHVFCNFKFQLTSLTSLLGN